MSESGLVYHKYEHYYEHGLSCFHPTTALTAAATAAATVAAACTPCTPKLLRTAVLYTAVLHIGSTATAQTLQVVDSSCFDRIATAAAVAPQQAQHSRLSTAAQHSRLSTAAQHSRLSAAAQFR
jgi:hypothetical protein